MFVTSKHVFEIKKCRNFLKDNDLLSAVSTFWSHIVPLFKEDGGGGC